MSTVNLIESFGEFKDLKNIDRVTMMVTMVVVFCAMNGFPHH